MTILNVYSISNDASVRDHRLKLRQWTTGENFDDTGAFGPALETTDELGRGLADARARGKTILRLKVVLEDGGWTLTPGVASGSLPRPTADRLRTAISLAHECGFIDQVEI